MARLEAAAICTPGLEPVCEAELIALGIKARTVGAGVVECKLTTRQLYAANLWSRTASRMLVRVAKFRATDFNFLETRAEEIPWDTWVGPGIRPEFRVTARKSKLIHTDAIAERLEKIVSPGHGREVARDAPVQPFVVRVDHDLFSISVDSSGDSLHQRGWRTETGVAPLRPTMAAALLLSAGWKADTPLLDPFCGSGTIAIEAALMARNLPPGGERDYAFTSWPDFEPGTWGSVKGVAAAEARTDVDLAIEASDRDAGAVEMTRANAERAGVSDLVTASEQVVSHLSGDQGIGLVATNPPYGKRVAGGDLRPLYRRFGAALRERRPQWHLAMVVADAKLAKEADGSLRPVGRYGHGGLKVQMLTRPGRAPTDQSEQPAIVPADPPATS